MFKNIDIALDQASEKKYSKQRLQVYLDFYKSNTEFILIRQAYKKGLYKLAFEKIVNYIKQSRKFVFLDVVFFDNDYFVDQHLNDYIGKKNHCVIRTQLLLYRKMKELKRTKKNKEANILRRLMYRSKRIGYALILMDKLSDYKKAFKEISHDFNAWIMAGCAEKNKRLNCLISDWRLSVPKNNLHRQLDKYLWQ